jgi:hypothetical protein
VLGFNGERLAKGFVQPGIALGRRIRMSGRRRSGFHGPGPGCGLVHAGALGESGPWTKFSLWAVFCCMNSKEIDFPLCFKYCPHMQRN